MVFLKEERMAEIAQLRKTALNAALEGRQVERVRALRARRDAGVHAAALRGVEDAARGGGNLMPHILNAVDGCSLASGCCNDERRGR